MEDTSCTNGRHVQSHGFGRKLSVAANWSFTSGLFECFASVGDRNITVVDAGAIPKPSGFTNWIRELQELIDCVDLFLTMENETNAATGNNVGLRGTNAIDNLVFSCHDFHSKLAISIAAPRGKGSQCVARAMFERFS
ncbi:hypothetical protein MKW98_000822 [Papaver atlanticum]|uniref:Uncharacterized protein n=1 Tax=Papaver atlanticum TaxID=357466 RepID=A0AAD4SDY9_9MAGN|nr:hypothetical protein MKW98_000822 [Papaver atlanticum]